VEQNLVKYMEWLSPAETGKHGKTCMMLEYALFRLERKLDLFYPCLVMQEWNESYRKMLIDALREAVRHERMIWMKKAENRPEITDEEILGYDNVPVAIAAAYIGMGKTSLRYALQDGRCPFGFSAERENPNRNAGASYAYNISPGMLVAYKKGDLQCMRESDVVRILKDAAKSIAEVV